MPSYSHPCVFEDDEPVLLPGAPGGSVEAGALMVARAERGHCRLISFSPRHDLTVSTLPFGDMRRVVDIWCDEVRDLGARPHIRHVQIFGERSAVTGSSTAHPHGRVWAGESLPNVVAAEQVALAEWLASRRRCMLCEYLALELEERERVVLEMPDWIALVPFWAARPFEMLLLPRRHVPLLPDCDEAERTALADAVQRIALRYDRVHPAPLSYAMGFHQAPLDDGAHPEWHLHAHFYPSLPAVDTGGGVAAGFEYLASPRCVIVPESGAALLRANSEPHTSPSASRERG